MWLTVYCCTLTHLEARSFQPYKNKHPGIMLKLAYLFCLGRELLKCGWGTVIRDNVEWNMGYYLSTSACGIVAEGSRKKLVKAVGTF